MINTKFEAYKIKRTLRMYGERFSIKRSKLNEYKEPIDDSFDDIGILKGIYHEQNSYVSINYGENVGYRNKLIPMMLCLHEDVEKLQLSIGDFFVFNGIFYKITGVNNIQQWNIIDDVSLEVVDYADKV